MNGRGIFHFLALVPAALALVGLLTTVVVFTAKSAPDSTKQNWPLPAAILIVILIMIVGIRKALRERNLLVAGAVTLGRVDRQKFFYRGRPTDSSFSFFKTSRIGYSFADEQLRIFRSFGTDYSKKYREDMSVLLFYDPSKTATNVAAPCSLFRLRTTS